MRWSSTLQISLFLAALGIAGAMVARLPVEEAAGGGTAIDGDSLRVDGREIRLKGIDAPEYDQTCQAAQGVVACGRDARRALAELLGRGRVLCRIAGRDRYRRDLAYCRVGDADLNALMVRNGHAVAYGGYEAEQREAKAARRGLWSTTFDAPAAWRKAHPRRRG